MARNFNRACVTGDLDGVCALLAQVVEMLHRRTSAGPTPCEATLKCGHVAVAAALLAPDTVASLDPTQQVATKCPVYWRALLSAAMRRSETGALEFVLQQQHGGVLDLVDVFGFWQMLLFSAVSQNRCDLVRVLIAHGADLTVRDRDGNSLLHAAVQCRTTKDTTIASFHLHALHLLLEKTSELIHSVNHRGNTPLFIAMERNNVNAVDLLLAFGADANLKTHLSLTPLHVARCT